MSTAQPWRAPHRTTPVDASIMVPGSKSLTNRALVLASLGDRPSMLSRPLISRDTNLMVSALTAFGAMIRQDGVEWAVSPISDQRSAGGTIDCGLAGTVMRFAPVIAALSSASFTFAGDERAAERPMRSTIDSLRSLGVNIDDQDRGTLPFTVHGKGSVDGGSVRVDASESSQFVSALLLAAPRFDQGLELRLEGAMPSIPHVEMTVAELAKRGVEVESGVGFWRVSPGGIESYDAAIEPDLSNAGPFIAAALVTGGLITIRSWPQHTNQAGSRWCDIAREFGGSAERHGEDMVFAGAKTLAGVDLDLGDVGELTPVVAALAALASGPSRLSGIGHLRGHETDRLAALTTEINRLGGAVTELEDGLYIEPRPLTGGTFATYHDHRMAQAAVVLGLRIADIFVENMPTTAKTYPNFAPVWERAMAQA